MERLPRWLLWASIALGLVLTITSLVVARSWMNSSADEAPIVWLPALAIGLGAFALLVVVPATLLVGRRARRETADR